LEAVAVIPAGCRRRRFTEPFTLAVTAASLSLAATSGSAAALHAQDPVPDLASLDLDELAKIRVTSASRKPEPVARTTAAIAVVTREDIRRSGAGSLPEALRLVPGLQVARVGTRDWAISARGFNQQSSNKLLLLIDGRTVYSPIFAGVFWDAVAMPFDEIDRVEVIRGPGATLWGANAVNGVINVITRPSSESRGGRITLGAGTRDRLSAGGRIGVPLGARASGRVYAAGTRRDRAALTDGADALDDWHLGQAGFRLDGAPSDAIGWMVQGNAYVGEGGSRLVLPTAATPYAELREDDLVVGGANVSGRWARRFGAESELAVQATYDYARRRQSPLFGTMTLHTVEAELQHHFPVGRRHSLIWGAAVRRVNDEITGATAINFDPAGRTAYRVSAFLQDDISLVSDRVVLTLGSKFADNEYTGFGVQPNVRLLVSPSPRHAVWGAVSRALRAGSRIDVDARAVAATFDAPVEARLSGSNRFEDEELTAYELGYRVEPHPRLNLDVALFYNDYDQLRTLALQAAVPADPRPILPVLITNQARGRSYGAEASATLRAARRWRLRGTYSYLQVRTAPEEGVPATVIVDAVPGDNPAHQASLWSSVDVATSGELDIGLRYVSELEGRGVPSYVTADARAGWRWGRRVELSVAGQDLLHERHAEFPTAAFVADRRLVARRVSARVVWRF
jgi:iron complex outermembrane receptor protein